MVDFKINPTVQTTLDEAKTITKIAILVNGEIVHVFMNEWPADRTTLQERRRFAEAIGGELVTLKLQLQVVGVTDVSRIRSSK